MVTRDLLFSSQKGVKREVGSLEETKHSIEIVTKKNYISCHLKGEQTRSKSHYLVKKYGC